MPKENEKAPFLGRVALVGAGAIGLYYGSRLALAGHDVSFLLRSDYEAVKARGICLTSVAGDARLKNVQGFRSTEEIGEVDWVLVTWKATANSNFRKVISPLIGENTQILTLQNGLGNCELLAKIFGAKRVLGGLCFVCLNRTAPGCAEHTAGGQLTIGEWEPQPRLPRANKIVHAFQQASVPAKVSESVAAAQWRKLVWNIPFNGLAIAEGGVTTEQLLSDPKVEAEIRLLMREVIGVAHHLGYEIDEQVIDFEIERTRKMNAYRPSSMIDYVDGKPVEYEAIWAEPLRRAQESGLDTPYLQKLAQRIQKRLAAR